MNFLEKDLETIIWENFERCAEKGLAIDQDFYTQGKLYRQLNLAPYGVADIVCIRFSAEYHAYYVQVIELKKGRIDSSAYFQAKRYLTAIVNLLIEARATGEKCPIYYQTIIIGSEVEESSDFVYGLNFDFQCRAFTYSYGFDGIVFKEVGKEWHMASASSSSSIQALSSELAVRKERLMATHKAEVASIHAALDEEVAINGDSRKALLVTSEGILVNEALLEDDLSNALSDGAE